MRKCQKKWLTAPSSNIFFLNRLWRIAIPENEEVPASPSFGSCEFCYAKLPALFNKKTPARLHKQKLSLYSLPFIISIIIIYGGHKCWLWKNSLPRSPKNPGQANLMCFLNKCSKIPAKLFVTAFYYCCVVLSSCPNLLYVPFIFSWLWAFMLFRISRYGLQLSIMS